MTGTTCGPIAEHWTGVEGGAVGARALASAVGSLDVPALEPWRDELAQAVDELSQSAGSPLRWDASDPVVALLRAVAALARSAPDACSTIAAGLIAVLGAGADESTGSPLLGRSRCRPFSHGSVRYPDTTVTRSRNPGPA